MEFGIAIPQTNLDPPRLKKFLKRADELPFAAAWSLEQVIGSAPMLDSVAT